MTVEFTAREAAAVAEEAFVFGFPLVLMERLRATMTEVDAPDSATLRAPINTFVHARLAGRPAGAEPTPDADALTTSAWLDLTGGPIVLSVPETHGHYYVLSLLDMWTGLFASVGARSTGTGPGAFAISGPGWHGETLPAGVRPITAPTSDVRMIGQTAVESGPLSRAAHAVQDAYRLTPLSRWHVRRNTVAPAVAEQGSPRGPDPGGASGVEAVARMGAEEFFGRLARLMERNPPRSEDRAVVTRMRALGLFGGAAYRGSLAPAIECGIRRGAALVMTEARLPHGAASGRWLVRSGLGRHGTGYLRRAGAAAAGLGTTSAADELAAILDTDADGLPLDGRHRYVMRFEPDAVPPVHGSWALSTHDERRLLAGDRIDRYSIGDRSGLKLDYDGALVLWIQADPPGRAHLANWLPAPDGPFTLLLRLFWPRAEAVEGAWSPPAARRSPSPPRDRFTRSG